MEDTKGEFWVNTNSSNGEFKRLYPSQTALYCCVHHTSTGPSHLRTTMPLACPNPSMLSTSKCMTPKIKRTETSLNMLLSPSPTALDNLDTRMLHRWPWCETHCQNVLYLLKSCHGLQCITTPTAPGSKSWRAALRVPWSPPVNLMAPTPRCSATQPQVYATACCHMATSFPTLSCQWSREHLTAGTWETVSPFLPTSH